MTRSREPLRFTPPDPLHGLSPRQIEALDDLEHNLDLINAKPTPGEIAWALSRVS